MDPRDASASKKYWRRSDPISNLKHIIDTRKQKGDRIRKQEIFYDSSCRNTSVRKEISRQFVCRLYLGVPRGWSICNLWFAKFVPFFAFLITINIAFQLHTTLPCFREVHQTNIMECNHKYELAVVVTTDCSHGAPLNFGAVVNDIWRWMVFLLVWANLWASSYRL